MSITQTKFLRIFLAEDHPFQLGALQAQLNSLGIYTLSIATSHSEALESLTNRPPYDLLICDKNLGDGCGYELIKQAYHLKKIKSAILFSGLSSSDEHTFITEHAAANSIPLIGYYEKPLPSAAILLAMDYLEKVEFP